MEGKMRHFTNVDLEKYVPNNWLKAHGIPVKRNNAISVRELVCCGG